MNVSNAIFLGDIALNGLFISDKENNKKRFEKVLPYFNENSFTIANLEVPIKTGNKLNPDKNIHFYTEEEIVSEVLPLLKVKLVTLANNHIGDFSLPGVKKTVDVLDRLGIMHSGAGYKPEHIDPVIFKINNKKVAFLAYVDKNTNPKTENIDGLYINYFDIEKVLNDIRRVKDEVDRIIVSIHWGIDYSYYPTKLQVKLTHKMIDEGAHIIIGHHTHTLQPFEKYKNGLIFYSLGGFCFGDHYQNGTIKALPVKTKKSIILKIDIIEKEINSIQSIKELSGNYIILLKNDIVAWFKHKWKIFSIMEKGIVYRRLIHFKESYFDRIYEFLFGYYKNPIKQFFRIFDYKRFQKLKIDSKNKIKRNI